MGTNYYLKPRPSHTCPTCGVAHGGDGEHGLHIGKSSGGWCFSLRVYPDGNLRSEYTDKYIETTPIRELEDWLPLLRKYGVVDEYGRDVSLDDMISTIIERPPWQPDPSKPARPLHRHEIEPYRCLGPGAGTYDLMLGDFS